MNKKLTDIVYGCVAVLFSLILWFILIPSQVQAKEAVIGEVQMFPRVAVIFIGMSGLVLIINRVMGISDKSQIFNLKNYSVNLKLLIKQIVFILVTLLFIKIIPLLGFVVATVLYVFSMLYYFGSKKLVNNIIISISFSFVSYILFSKLFKVGLPEGLLPF